MKIAVVGGSGFLGSHVADALSERGHQVRLVDQRPSSYRRPHQEMVLGDIVVAEQMVRALDGCDMVYNFAGLTNLEEATTKPIETVQLNILGNASLLEAARAVRCRRFVYASTIYVYSELGGFYRCSKQAAESYVEEYQRRYQLDFTILRYGTLYGPRANPHTNSVARYLHQALTEGRIQCGGTGDEMREYLHVSDAAALSVEILEEAYRNKHVIVTGHHPMKFRDLLFMIREMLGNQVAIEFEPHAHNNTHYTHTPYTFLPKIGQKLTSNRYTDLGQGLLECLHELHDRRSQIPEPLLRQP